MSSGVVIVVFNFVILGLAGNTGVAAYGIIVNIALVIISIFTGISEGIQPLVSRSYGKGEKDNVKKVKRAEGFPLRTQSIQDERCACNLLF